MKDESLRTLIDDLLLDQQQISAVEKFSQKHQQHDPGDSKIYSDLIPLSKPGVGEQYAFEVDLDVCSGCKACVVACHSLNGLDDTETWRDVGTLIGEDNAIQQTVTTACHHCADPACLNGCPTRAYEKDNETGIVKHLDDQCIGCRYCEMKCPYEVPKYNDRLGIVRKCDMCHGRLSEGEAPACVQACPNEAIKIRIVSSEEILERDNPLVPGTVPSTYTSPSTQYLNVKEDCTPSDDSHLKPAHAHWPLVGMLILTQAGLGILASEYLTRFANPEISLSKALLGAALLFAGLTASVLHLGQPLKAWKAFLGWRTSWLSREIIVFGALGGLVSTYLVSLGFKLPDLLSQLLGGAMVLTGILAIWTSVKVYSDTKRPFWNTKLNLLRFFGTSISFGLLCSSLPAYAAATIVTLLILDWSFTKGENRRFSQRLRGPLRVTVLTRQTLGILAVMFIFVPWLPLLLFLASEIAGRSLFFRAVDEPKMPGV